MNNPFEPSAGSAMPAYNAFPPQNTPQVQYAGAGLRLVSLLVDNFAFSVVYIPFAFLVGLFDPVFKLLDESAYASSVSQGELNRALLLATLVGAIVWMVYRCVCESVWGRTLGRLVTRTKVVQQDASTPSFVQSLLRNAWYPAVVVSSMLPAFLGTILFLGVYIGLGVTISRNPFNQSFMDKQAKTFVIRL